VAWPLIAMISLPLHPASASRRHGASLAARTVIAVAANAVVSAVEGTPQIDASQDAEFQSDTAPAADGSLGAARVSVFQKDSVALRLRWPITWTLRTPSALAWMTGVNW
jgi:hypothetical protein